MVTFGNGLFLTTSVVAQSVLSSSDAMDIDMGEAWHI